jgi:hypothetical protein
MIAVAKEICEGCFAFDTERHWLFTLETLQAQFGPTYFEAVARHEATRQIMEK